jgi:hypothetical protein
MDSPGLRPPGPEGMEAKESMLKEGSAALPAPGTRGNDESAARRNAGTGAGQRGRYVDGVLVEWLPVIEGGEGCECMSGGREGSRGRTVPGAAVCVCVHHGQAGLLLTRPGFLDGRSAFGAVYVDDTADPCFVLCS